MTKQTTISNETIGILLRVLSGLAFTAMGGLIKYLAETVPLGQVVFFRSAFAFIPLFAFLIWQKDFPSGFRTSKPMGHLIRCLLGTSAMFTAFATLRYLPVAEATTLSYLSPVILVFLAAFWLKEVVSRRRWLGVALGLSGLLVMTLPNFSLQSDSRTLLGILLGVLTAILIACALLQVRKLAKMGEKSSTITIYFAITSAIISAFTALSGWVEPTPIQWWCLIGIGIIGGIAQLLMTVSFSYAEASALAPYEYLSIIWAVIMGIIFFAEIPNLYFYLAMPLILLGAIVAKPKRKH